MFQGIQTYHGNLIDVPHESEAFEAENQVQNEDINTAEAIISVARQEAATILEAAREQASRERDEMLAEAREKADHLIAVSAVEQVARLNAELGSSRSAMVDVLENALDRIIGDLGTEKAASLAILNALRDFRDEKNLHIHANGKTIERLQLFAVGRKKELNLLGIVFVRDPSMDEGRCIVSTGSERVEIGIDAQLAALKKLFASERELSNRGQDHQA